MTVHVKGGFNVDLYVDMNGQWASGDRASQIVWELDQQELGDSQKGLKTWKVRRATELLLSEIRDQAEWGTLHFTAPSVSFESLTEAILKTLTACRTFAMKPEHPVSFGSAFLALARYRTSSTTATAVSWMKSLFSPFLSPSSSTPRPQPFHRAATRSCSPSPIYKTQ